MARDVRELRAEWRLFYFFHRPKLVAQRMSNTQASWDASE